MQTALQIRGDAAIAAHGARAGSFSDQLVLALAAIGITQYFGVPGGAIEPLFNALARSQRLNKVQLTTTRGEAGAAFAADGYYRETGRMAVCTSTTGPGISNLITAVINAHADRIPMLVLTPQITLAKQGRGGLQDSSSDGYDLERMLSECTRYSSTVSHPDQLGHKLTRAVRLALSAPMGPVHLSIPSDILAGRPATEVLRLCPTATANDPVDRRAVDELLDALNAARSPIFYVGDDAGSTVARLLDLALAARASVVSSPAGKRWLGHSHPAYLGVSGFSGHAEANRAVAAADLVVAFGATFDELSTNAWTALPETTLYSVDAHTEHAYRVPNAKPVVSSVASVVDAIAKHVPAPHAAVCNRRAPAARLLPNAGTGSVHPSYLMQWLSQALPPSVVVHIDAGNGFSWSTRDLLRSQPDTYRVSMGLSTMGWAISAAIGAAVASGRRTICVTGDGSMLMSSLELTVAVERNLPVTYLILNDASLGMVRHGQRLAEAESIAHEIAPVRFDRIAKACGARGLRITSAEELGRIPRSWLASDQGGPALIDVCIDRAAVPPMADRVKGLGLQGSNDV